ncbi:hypothetical protein GCM10007874_54490 [Labrys miyagiensis]|uniref:Uncharacterized protein n=1 Tax=Labrys miyagiensis TaxID=346912 RepID=A0ABQ6CW10_9HYPH|nr:hypothetical protein [Labrys miyagiensis]GLS22431.1 hypothetical protein GCM10007874_54490 [Labrys miyagiensis]
MIAFKRDTSGLYLADTSTTARVAFLFQDASRTDPTFDLTAQSWIDPSQLGYIAFFAPSATRDWKAFEAGIRAAFTANTGTQIGWFPEPLGTTSVLVAITGQGTSSPTVAESFSLTFRQSVTFQVQPDLFGLSTTVLFDDASNSLQIANSQPPATLLLTATPPAGATVTFQSTAPFASLALTGPLAGTASAAFELAAADLVQFEAGLMYFNPPVDGGLVNALSYPVFRGAGGSTTPFGFNVTLDMLAPLDAERSFFQFTDTLLGSTFVTANGKPFALSTVNTGDIGTASRLVFAGRPQQSPSEQRYYYLTPAGQFGLALDTGTSQAAAATSETVQMLCGVTGTEFVTVTVGSTPDKLEFVPAQPAYRIAPAKDSSTNPAFLDATATTSWAQLDVRQGTYVSQPERAPLYKQPDASAAVLAGAPPASGLSVYVLDYFPVPSWSATGSAPAVPLVPYAGLDFSTNPNLKAADYLDMESRALNPRRAAGFVSAPEQRIAANPAPADQPTKTAMTPQGMLAELAGTPLAWTGLQMATSAAGILEFEAMGPSIRKAVQQNQIFTVVSENPASADPLGSGQSLFDFTNDKLEIGDWTFNLSPGGLAAPGGTPPIFMLKFYPGETIEELVTDTRLWSQPDTFNKTFTATCTQTYLQKLIAEAKASVFPGGSKQPDTTSLYWNFYQTVTDPTFNGILAVNCNMQLDDLPTAVRAVLGGMTDPGIAGFRVHHVGIAINNTDSDPSQTLPKLAQSATFALVDYEKAASKPAVLDIDYGFEVEYLRALFTNSELRSFACEVNLTINNLFKTGVNLDAGQSAAANAGDDGNVIAIMGSYQAHGTSGDDTSSGQGVYSFVAQGDFVFNFTDDDGKSNNKYLKKITLTKLQFSFDDETAVTSSNDSTTTHITAHFAIWGDIEFNELQVLDLFAFEKLAFSNLGIDVGFDLTIYKPSAQKQPSTSALSLSFAPGDLRLDLGASAKRSGADSLLDLIPFKLKSFLYSDSADETIESLNYYSLGSLPGLAENGITLQDKFNYALIFDLDLGSMGGLVGSLSAFKFSVLIGWLSPGDGGGLAFGIQLPQVDGKLEIKIEGVLTISIEQFNLEYATDADPKMLVLGMHNCFIEILGQRLPPDGTISIGLFAPTEGADQIGWIGAYNKGKDGGGGGGGGDTPELLAAPVPAKLGAVSDVFDLVYLGIGQRVGPDPAKPPANFDAFLTFMQGDFWDKLQAKKFSDIYHPDGKWIIITDFTLLKVLQVGFVFYDVTPFYALLLRLTGGAGKGAEFEIVYTKISDTIGKFAAVFSLPDSLRTFQVGAASLTLPTLSVDVYTNGDWKADLGFPDADNWSVCFQVQAQAGPIPVTGSGGFYIASLSSATDPDVFKGTYQSILAFGFAARLGVGKDFTAGPLKAGVSVTFFGIIQGAAGYLTSGGGDLTKKPDALSLQGQFGIIGELYGSLDFVIIKASVNVRLEASIGIILALEPPSVPGGGGGSILLYIEASVSVSVTVEINLFFFSISISFSFNASFRFEWQLAGSSQQAQIETFARLKQRLLAGAAPNVGLLPNLPKKLPILFLPELTVVFPDATSPGTPWLVTSLGIQYDDNPPQNPTYADFKPFEAVTTQLATFALMHALNLPAYNSVVLLEFDPSTGTPGLKDIDSEPDALTGWIDYPTLLGQLANFSATLATPTGKTKACVFPMPPFLNLATSGRTDGKGNAQEFSYQFQAQNLVSQSYLQTVDTYFNQLFVNQTSNSAPANPAAGTTPLSQEIFLDYFKGLIRGAVHELLVTMQNAGLTSSPLDKLFMAAVAAPTPGAQTRFQGLAGQMSSALRGGVRLPYTAGLTVPGGAVSTRTNPLFALLWQEFPAGGFAKGNSYTITLTNPDATQDWLSVNASFSLTQTLLDPYLGLTEASVTAPSSPAPIALSSTGPQSFALENAIAWTPPNATAVSLRPFAPSLAKLQVNEGTALIPVLVNSRQAQGAYLPDGTPLPAGDITFATSITLTVKQIPGATQGSMLPDVYALSGASQADEALLGRILDDLRGGDRPVDAIQILFQTAAGASGLVSAVVDPDAVFALRTNTTTVSQPPQGLMGFALGLPAGVSVGASTDITADGGYGFLQIIQQATVTNASGYYLRFVDKTGNALPSALFVKGVAQVMMLVTYKPGSGTNQAGSPLAIQPYYNAVVLAGTQSGLVYYAETADPALEARYVKVAAGTFGVELTRAESVMQLKTPAAVAKTGLLAAANSHSRGTVIEALRASGITADTELHEALAAAGGAQAALNSLYSLVTYQVQATTGFTLSNLSAPIQPQKPDQSGTTGTYRVFAPLYNVATANVGSATPNRYASINDKFTLSFFVNDAFGNQLPTPATYGDTNLYFDPIVPVDQWPGILPTYGFDGSAANTVELVLTPSQAAFSGMSADQTAAVLANFRTIEDQINGSGVSFYVETSLALQADGSSLVNFPLPAADASKVTGMVADLVNWLAGLSPNFPGAVTISMPVSGPGALPPLFEIVVLLGITRNINLISPYLKDQFGTVLVPSVQNVATGFAPATGGASNMSQFAADFTGAFPAQKLAIGMNGAEASSQQKLSSTALARKRLKALKLAHDGSGGARAGSQSLWAAAASLLDISIGAAGGGPRFLSPKPLDNVLNSASVQLPQLSSKLPALPAQQLFIDTDLDQLNRAFFQAVDEVLSPASAAKAFELAQGAYDAIALGRETLAQKYAQYEVDWLFGPQSPFTGTTAALAVARDVFEQQMRSALMTAYSVDTIVQYDVTWNQSVSAAADGTIELFGQIEAMLAGSYSWSGLSLSATTTNPHGLTDGSRVLMIFQASSGPVPTDGVYTVTVTSETAFTIATTVSGSGSGTFSATRQNAGLSTAHVGISSTGRSPLTFLYGDPDAAAAAVVPFDLRFAVTNLQFFLAPAGAPGEARPSIWLQLVDPYPQGVPHVGPAGALTNIPVVYRQYPTPPTLISQTWSGFKPASPSSNPIADGADWSYLYTYQAFLVAQDQINTAVTYNTDLSAASNTAPNSVSELPGASGPYDLFTALARTSAVYGAISPVLRNPTDPAWADAVAAFATAIGEVTANKDWNPGFNLNFVQGLANVTDSYVVTDALQPDGTTRLIELQWPAAQGESSFANVALSVTALDPSNLTPYPNQHPVQPSPPNGLLFEVDDAAPGNFGVAHTIEVDALNVLAAENALASVQIERNLITLDASDNTAWQVVPEFIYKTPQVRPSQPVTPFIDNVTPIDVTTLPGQGSGAACPTSPSSLCQRIYTIMADLLADPVQARSLLAAHAAASVTSGTQRRVKVGCSYQFPFPAVAGGAFDGASISPLVPIVLARSFEIDGQQPAELGDFASIFAAAIAGWASDNSIVFGAGAVPAGAMLVFDITLYAALSGVNTPVLRFSNLQLKLTDIDAN